MKYCFIFLVSLATIACNSNNATVTGANNADTVVLTPEFDGQQSSPQEPTPPPPDSLRQKKK